MPSLVCFSRLPSAVTCDPLYAVALSPEGVPTEATCALAELAVSPPGPDVIVNINADSTAAFAAWAMGSTGGGAPDPAVAPLEPGAHRNITQAQPLYRLAALLGEQACLVVRASCPATWSGHSGTAAKACVPGMHNNQCA